MIRTQIQLSEDQAKRLRDLAAREGRSMADIVRESLSEYLPRHQEVDREELKRRSLEVLGTFRSGAPDVAERHDRHLDEIYGEGV